MPRPTDSELEILQILWEKGPSTVRSVNDYLNQKRNVGYTTTLKIMQIMIEKQMLTRELSNRSHIYSPIGEPDDIRKSVIDHLVQTAFNGNTSNLVLQALGNHTVTEEEMKKIRNLLNEMEV